MYVFGSGPEVLGVSVLGLPILEEHGESGMCFGCGGVGVGDRLGSARVW